PSGLALVACTLDAAPVACDGTVSGEGAHHATIHAEDAAGNSADASFDLAIDSEDPGVFLDPTCATPGTAGWCRASSYGYDGGAGDITSGLADGSPACTADGSPAACNGTISGEGSHHVTIGALDNAGRFAFAQLDLAIDSAA